jgi:hypothetical protein
VALLIVQRAGYAPARAGEWRCWVIGAGRDAWETTLGEACEWLRPEWGTPAEVAS